MRKKQISLWAFLACAMAPLPAQAQYIPRTGTAPTTTLPDGSPVIPDRRPGNPDLPTAAPALQLGKLRIGSRELSYQAADGATRFDWRLQYGSGAGVDGGFNYAHVANAQWAWGLNFSAGAKRADVVLNGLYSPTPQWHVGASIGYLDRTDPYSFFTGSADASAIQLSHRLSLQRSFDANQPLSDLGLQWYGARVIDTDSDEHVEAQETATELRWWLDPRRLAPGRLNGWGATMGLRPWEGGRLRLALGTEEVSYSYQDGTGSRERRATSSIDLSQQLNACWRVDGGLRAGVAANQWRVGIGRGAWALTLNRVNSRQNGPGDTTLAFTLNMPLDGSGRAACSGNGSALASSKGFDRLEHVYRRPVELPTTILAKVDPTARPYLLASFVKADLGGAQVSATPDALVLTIPGGAVQSVAILLVDGVPVPNVGTGGAPLLAPMNGALRINIRQFPNPGPGVTQQVQAVLVMDGGMLGLVSFNVVGS